MVSRTPDGRRSRQPLQAVGRSDQPARSGARRQPLARRVRQPVCRRGELPVVDGSVHFIKNAIDPSVLKALGTPKGGERALAEQY